MDRVCCRDDLAANSGLGRLDSVLQGHDLRFGHGNGGAIHRFMALAWLIGSLLGLAFRFLNKPPKAN
jgi:hypothetical protein